MSRCLYVCHLYTFSWQELGVAQITFSNAFIFEFPQQNGVCAPHLLVSTSDTFLELPGLSTNFTFNSHFQINKQFKYKGLFSMLKV